MKTIQITNQDIYNENVINVDLDFHKGSMNGDVAIETPRGEKLFTGEHGMYDYEDDYGFIIVDEKYYIIDATSNSSSTAYVCEDGETIHTTDNAMSFDTAAEAQAVIDSNNWTWASVVCE